MTWVVRLVNWRCVCIVFVEMIVIKMDVLMGREEEAWSGEWRFVLTDATV